MTEQQKSTEAARGVQQALDIGHRVRRCPDAAITLACILFDELAPGSGVLDGVGERDEAGRGEVVRKILQAVCAILNCLITSVSQVDDRQHPPILAVGFGTARLRGLVGDDLPGVL
jgi:hypothetical protein